MAPKNDSVEIAARRRSDVASEKTDNDAEKHNKAGKSKEHDAEKHVETEQEISPADPGSSPSNGESDEPVAHEYATPRELSLLSTVFTIATFMIAIDGSILGKTVFCC